MQHTLRTGALALGVLTALAAAPPALGQSSTEIRDTEAFRGALSAKGASTHLEAFQRHSDQNGGSRVAGSPAFEASARYVKEQAAAAGYETSDHFFEFRFNADRTPPMLDETSPQQQGFVDGVDYASMTFSENAALTTAKVWAVDLVLPNAPAPGATTSGCEAADFAGMPAGAIALVQRGTCSFALKALNAENAGAVAAVIFNDGGDAGREGVINGTLGGPDQGAALGTTLALGQDLANGIANGDTGSTATVRIDRVNEVRRTRNVIAETPNGDPSRVVVVGAHLDSVSRGPGINDNGTGSAGILEIARALRQRDVSPRNKIRFMWYSAEEFGLLGSRAYVNSLLADERSRIKAMLNFDMIGSPNFARFVYDGDNSAFPAGAGSADGPPGSGELERIFRDYFAGSGLKSGETPFSGRSDYGPFIAVGIPAGGLFTGAEGVKTAQQAAVYGGTAGQSYDPCYHLACDTLANVNMTGFEQMLDAAGHATMALARRDLDKRPLVDPSTPVSGTDSTTGGGGLHDDHDHEVESR